MFSKTVLYVMCVLGTTLILCSCGDVTLPTPENKTAQTCVRNFPENVVFKGKKISTDDYIALIGIFERLSYEQTNISDEVSFAAFVGAENAYLYDLYSFILSLDASESASLYHDIMYMPEMS